MDGKQRLVKFYETTRCCIPEDITLHSHHCEKLRSSLSKRLREIVTVTGDHVFYNR
jgi:hypothetical protein